MKELIVHALQGTVLGIAMIIPGVSGGTMALVMGIYERLIMTVNELTPKVIKEFLPPYPDGIMAKWKVACLRLDILFLVALAAGAVVAMGALSRLMPYLIENHHEPTFGFFLGLILASVIVPLKLIKKITPAVLVMGVIGVVAAGGLGHADNHRRHDQLVEANATANAAATAVATETPDKKPETIKVTRLGFIALAMGIAMSACILPGVSGSLIMVILGTYTDVLGAISGVIKAVLAAKVPPLEAILILCCAIVGAAVGLVSFARIMKFLLKRFHDATMGGLVGLMIGSLYVIWPFRESGKILSRSKEKLVFGYPQTPAYDGTFWLTVAMAFAGIGIIILMDVIDRKRKA